MCIAPFLWALFGAWGMALEYMAYPLENAGVLFSEQKQLAKSIRLGALSFGGVAAMGLDYSGIKYHRRAGSCHWRDDLC